MAERSTTHLPWSSPEHILTYNSYRAMIQRCENPNDTAYANYGGRGIKICERWRKSCHAFIDDMGYRPSKDHSIDRIDNGGDYEPGNCKWSTQKEQQSNRRPRTCNTLTYNGETLTIRQWAERLSTSYERIRFRIHSGWSLKDVLTTPIMKATDPRSRNRHPKP